ncbi:MAG: hypothetical protein WBG54_05405 [Acidobacteriaceae bacterium]
MGYPKASSSGDSSGVPQVRQMTAEQSPQTSGSGMGRAHTGHHRGCGPGGFCCGTGGGEDILHLRLASALQAQPRGSRVADGIEIYSLCDFERDFPPVADVY